MQQQFGLEGISLPELSLLTIEGNKFDLEYLYARPCVLFYFFDVQRKDSIKLLTEFNKTLNLFTTLGISIIGISPTDEGKLAQINQELKLDYMLLSDKTFAFAKKLGIANLQRVSFGIEGVAKKVDKTEVSITQASFAVDSMSRIRKVFIPEESGKHPHQIINQLNTVFPELVQQPVQKTNAPVLIVPNVLPNNFCNALLSLLKAADYKVDNLELSRREKIQEFVNREQDNIKPLLQFIDAAIARHVVPQIYKSFAFDATRMEPVFILQSSKEDNAALRLGYANNDDDETSHRKFVMYINLNTQEFEGGAVQLPEYGNTLYKVNSGDAIIFSAYCLEAVTPIISGEKWMLGAYLYGESEAKLRERERDIREEQDIPDPIF